MGQKGRAPLYMYIWTEFVFLELPDKKISESW